MLKIKSSLCLPKHHAVKPYGAVELYLHVFLIAAVNRGELPTSRSNNDIYYLFR
jgi:hypothetical protein